MIKLFDRNFIGISGLFFRNVPIRVKFFIWSSLANGILVKKLSIVTFLFKPYSGSSNSKTTLTPICVCLSWSAFCRDQVQLSFLPSWVLARECRSGSSLVLGADRSGSMGARWVPTPTERPVDIIFEPRLADATAGFRGCGRYRYGDRCCVALDVAILGASGCSCLLSPVLKAKRQPIALDTQSA